MAMKALDKRVRDAFEGEEARAFGDKYLEMALASLKDASAGVRRTVTVIVLLVVAFVVLAGAKRAEFSFGPLKLKDVSPVLVLFPALVSFLYYEYVVQIFSLYRYQELWTALFAVLHPTLRANDLEDAVSPGTVSVWGANPWQRLRVTKTTPLSTAVEVLGIGLAVATLVGAVAFLVYAYWRLFRHPAVGTVPVAISLVFSAFNLLRTALTFVDEMKATGATFP